MVYYYENIRIIALSYIYKTIIYYVENMTEITKRLFNILDLTGQSFLE